MTISVKKSLTSSSLNYLVFEETFGDIHDLSFLRCSEIRQTIRSMIGMSERFSLLYINKRGKTQVLPWNTVLFLDLSVIDGVVRPKGEGIDGHSHLAEFLPDLFEIFSLIL